MYDITFKFEELGLDGGEDRQGNPIKFGLFDGEALIDLDRCDRHGEGWEISTLSIRDPWTGILHEVKNAAIKGIILESLILSRGDLMRDCVNSFICEAA